MQPEIFQRLEIEIKRANYAYERYQLESTFVLVHHENPISAEDLGKAVRITDKFVQVDEQTHFIIFTYTSEENTFKATKHLLHHLDNFFNNTTTCIAVSYFDASKSPRMIVNKLTQILLAARKNSYSRIEDEEILNDIV